VEVRWELVAAIVTAVSTATLAVMAVARPIMSGARQSLAWRAQRHQAKLVERMELDPVERIEILNISSYQGNIMNIMVRNRSHIPVSLRSPVFEIRGHQSHLPGSGEQATELQPGETDSFMMEFPGDVADSTREDCVLVDTGRPDRG